MSKMYWTLGVFLLEVLGVKITMLGILQKMGFSWYDQRTIWR
jgi:hypothetical protein